MSDGFISVPSRRQTNRSNYLNDRNSGERHHGHHAGSRAGHHHDRSRGANGHHPHHSRDGGHRSSVYTLSLPSGPPGGNREVIAETNPVFSNPFAYLNEVDLGDGSELEREENKQKRGKDLDSSGSSSLEPAATNDDGEDVTELGGKCLAAAEKERIDTVLVEMGLGPHPLAHEWSFWYLRPPAGSKSNQTNYESLLKCIATFSTVEDFWAIYLRLKRPEHLDNPGSTTDYSLFRSEIRPVWEDPANAHGGKLLIRLRRGGSISARFWETIVLALIGGSLHQYEHEICGLVFSIRPYEDIIAVWTRHSQDMTTIQRLREQLKWLFGLSAATLLEYKPHHYVKGPATQEKDSLLSQVSTIAAHN